MSSYSVVGRKSRKGDGREAYEARSRDAGSRDLAQLSKIGTLKHGGWPKRAKTHGTISATEHRAAREGGLPLMNPTPPLAYRHEERYFG